jgi:hypothetical protein
VGSNLAASDPTAIGPATASSDGYPTSFYTGPAGATNLLPPNGTYPSNGAWLGIAPGGPGKTFDDGTNQQLSREAAVGHKIPIAHRFAGSCSFPTPHANALVANGWIPMISWQFNSFADQVINGSQDACITSFAQGAASWGHPFFLRIFWEFNGDWMNYSKLSTGGLASSTQERDMWRHTVDVMTRAGLTKASFVWAPGEGHYGNGDTLNEAAAYPGDNYVDWVASDGYNYNSSDGWCGAMGRPHTGWCTFEDIFHDSIVSGGNVEQDFRGRKPYMVAETGSTEGTTGQKQQWLTDADSRIKAAFPGLYAFVYFDIDTRSTEGCCNWRLDSTANVLDGFNVMADDAFFMR